MTTTEIQAILDRERQRELLATTALVALVGVNARRDSLMLFGPMLAERLRATDDGDVYVVDARGNQRHGMSPETLALEVRADYDTRHPGRYFETHER